MKHGLELYSTSLIGGAKTEILRNKEFSELLRAGMAVSSFELRLKYPVPPNTGGSSTTFDEMNDPFLDAFILSASHISAFPI